MKSRGFLGIVFAFLAFSLLLTSCSKGKSEQDIESKGLPSSGGKTLEAILVIPDEVYKGEIKDSIGEYFMKACPWLPQPEPLFDVVQMNPVGFYNSEMFTKHRNIIIVDIKRGKVERCYSIICDFCVQKNTDMFIIAVSDAYQKWFL
mgnify:CR=1 FL=1